VEVKKKSKTVSLRTREQVLWEEIIILGLRELNCPGGVKRGVAGKKEA